MAPGVRLLLMSMSLINSLANAQEDIRLPPSITRSPLKLILVPEKTRVSLTCTASGHPLPTMSWRKDSLPLNSTGIIPTILPPGNGTIEIVEMSVLHLGQYQCFASNEHGTTMTNVSLVALATIDNFPPNAATANVTVQANAALRLPCNPPASVPEAEVSWSWNSSTSPLQTPVLPSKSVQIDYNGDLCFASVNVTEVQPRLYRCNAFNEPQSTTRSGSYSRIVGQGSVANVAPQLVFSSSRDFTGLRSMQTVLRCFFSGSGTMNYQWTYNGGSSLPSGWTFADTDLSSPESGTSDADAGTFTCYGNNGQGTPASATITLKVEAIPDFGNSSNRIRDVNATEGDHVIFSCATEAIPPATVRWYKNTEPFDVASLPPKFSLSADLLTLTITDLCKNCSDGTSDLMVVQCNSSNVHGYSFAQGYINVLLPTVIESEPVSVPWVAHATYSFECLATCDDSTPCSVQWSFDGTPLEPNGSSVTIGADGSLTIVTAGDADAGASRIGDYECLVTNGYSEQTITSRITGAHVAAAELWWVGLLVALLILLLLLLVLCCCFFCYYREGKSYPVDKNERKNGNDPVKELHEIGFQNFVHSKNGPINIYTNPTYGRDEVAPPIFTESTAGYKVSTGLSTPSGSRKGGYGSRNSPVGSAQNIKPKSAYSVDGNHSWNASEV